VKPFQLTLGGLLACAAVGAAAATDDVGGPGSAMLVLFYAEAALALMSLPALYILFRPGPAWTIRLVWLLALAAVDLGSCGLLYLAFFGGGSGDAMMTPIPWLLVLVPGYVLAYSYQRVVDGPAASANEPGY
jgi:hypothetical protein